MSSGKNLSLLLVVAVAAGATILFAKKDPQTGAPEASAAAPRETLARRLPAKGPGATSVRHLLTAREDSSLKTPTASTAGSADLSLGVEFSPSTATGYGRSFNPAGALLEPRIGPSEQALQLGSDPGPEIEPPTTATGRPRTHVVVDGDTLSSLAARYLGSSDRYREIFAANRKVLSTPDLLPIGAELEIPPLEIGANPGSSPAEPDSTASGIVPVPKGALRGDD